LLVDNMYDTGVHTRLSRQVAHDGRS
jgi:hypothetical protein